MTFQEQLKDDLNQAMKNGETLKVETLRGLLAAIHNREIELRGKEKELDEEEVLAALSREAKKRREAKRIYSEAGRADLADKESKELEIIQAYLPPQMSSEEIEAIVKKVAQGGVTEFGRVMGAVMQEVKGRREAGEVKEIVERVLAEK
ncbi:MAG: GatB/YqeY domain-containing protein [Candidatus Colwellbacteria bacterium]|nr:GatB/YqeY domain-containing protein [Candidatus Colwellbacteria bacterium]